MAKFAGIVPDGGDWAGSAHGDAVAVGAAGDTVVVVGADDAVALAEGGRLSVAVCVPVEDEALDPPPPHAVSANTLAAHAAWSGRRTRPV